MDNQNLDENHSIRDIYIYIFIVISTLQIYNLQKLQGMVNNVGITFHVGDTTPWITILSKTIGISDTKYHILCTYDTLTLLHVSQKVTK